MAKPIASAAFAIVSIGVERRWRRLLCDDWTPPCRSWEELHHKYSARLQAAAGAPSYDTYAAVAQQDFAETSRLIKASPVVVKGSWHASIAGSAPKISSGAIVVVGTCHYSTEAAAKCCSVIEIVRPSCLILELCTERMLPILACPPEHRASWLTAKIPGSLGPGLWESFSIDQECSLAHQDGLDMVRALDTLVNSGQRRFLVALADATQSEREADDPARDELLAKACIAGVVVGHDVVVAVVGADHVDSITHQLSRLGNVMIERVPTTHLEKYLADRSDWETLPSLALRRYSILPDSAPHHAKVVVDSLEVKLADDELARSCFLSPTAIASLLTLRSELSHEISPRDVAVLRSEVVGASMREKCVASIDTLRSFERKAELRGTSPFLKKCLEEGSVIQPHSLSELEAWWFDDAWRLAKNKN